VRSLRYTIFRKSATISATQKNSPLVNQLLGGYFGAQGRIISSTPGSQILGLKLNESKIKSLTDLCKAF